jgi:hypothetical protein
MFRMAWNRGKNDQRRYQEALLVDDVPDLPDT